MRPNAVLLAVALAIALAWTGPAPARAADDPAGGQFLALSDLHFDPMADPALVDRLAAARPEDWAAILARSQRRGSSRFGEDTDWALLDSALRQMRVSLPRPAFLLVPGDLLAHAYRQRFDKSAADHADPAYRAFVLKSMWFLAGRLRAAFPNLPILLALGNNDADCGDYRLAPGGPFLRDTLPILRALAGAGLAPGFDADWAALGNYAVAHPTLPGVRLIFLNTVFLSRSYRNACGGGDPATQTLDWLGAELERARQDGIKLWLVYHIPPGIDVYATRHGAGCPDAIVPMWQSPAAVRFTAITHEFADVVAASFAGHTHMDEFRLTGEGGEHDGFVLIVPALSPIYGQNPAFQVFAYGADGAILDSTTHYLADVVEAASGAPPDWRTEPRFTEEWLLPRIDLRSLEALNDRIRGDRDAAERWLSRYAVSRADFWPLSPEQGLLPTAALDAYRCGIASMSVADYERCWCAAK